MSETDDAAIVDLLVPTLFLDTNTARAIWADCPWSGRCQLDTFNIHHLLQSFEPAMRRAISSGSNTVIKALRPILSLLMGDLNFFAPRFGVWLLAHWCELLHGQSVAGIHVSQAPEDDDFLRAWLAWRRAMVLGGQNMNSLLSVLTKTAQTPSKRARVELEKGYGLLVAGEQLDPHQWLDIMEVNAGIVGRGLPSDDVDPVPWIPILRSLAKPLQMNAEPELAYQCLVASPMPSSRTSAFERKAFQVNDKQSVISDHGIGAV
jgi:hypothetical protein